MMKNAFPALLLVLLMAAFLACKNEKPAPQKDETPSISLEKSWVIDLATAKNLPAKSMGSPAQLRMSEGIYGESGRSGFSWHFFPGGAATEFRGQKYQEGKWEKDDEIGAFRLVFADGKSENFLIKYLSADSLSVTVGTGKMAGDIAFRTDGARYGSPEQNPYHPANNQWRIKPTAAETDAQLRARIRNHIHHLALILEAGLKHKMKVVSFKATPSCLHQYNSAVGLENESDLTAAWYDCFFDKNDAKKAYKMLEHEMKTNGKAATDASKQWVENNYIILQHLESGFEN